MALQLPEAHSNSRRSWTLASQLAIGPILLFRVRHRTVVCAQEEILEQKFRSGRSLEL